MNLPVNLVVETKRFTLTPVKHEDKEAVFITMNCPNTANIISFLKWPMNMEQASSLCLGFETLRAAGRGCLFLGRSKENSFPIGCIGLGLSDHDENTGEVGYWVTENWQKHGCATEMLTAIIDFAFSSSCNLSRLVATAALHNHVSIKILEKQGFHIIGSKELPTVKGTTLDCHFFELKK